MYMESFLVTVHPFFLLTIYQMSVQTYMQVLLHISGYTVLHWIDHILTAVGSKAQLTLQALALFLGGGGEGGFPMLAVTSSPQQ